MNDRDADFRTCDCAEEHPGFTHEGDYRPPFDGLMWHRCKTPGHPMRTCVTCRHMLAIIAAHRRRYERRRRQRLAR
ncbi:MAG: hypothetical protein WAK16_08510, partial [Candidatus Cybelea sp.]